MENPPPMPEKDKLELEIARQNRKFEISLFWQRANYFLVLNTALAVGAYTVSDIWLKLFLCLFGVLVSRLWFRTNIGAKFWQLFWEKELSRLAEANDIRAMYEPESEIRARALGWEVGDDSPWHKKYVHRKMISLKPEVSHNMILLSLSAIWAWLVLSFFLISQLILLHCEGLRAFFSAFSGS